MVVIEPVKDDENEDEGEEWFGSIKQLESITKRQLADLKLSLTRRTD